jgi:hypothetical protein
MLIEQFIDSKISQIHVYFEAVIVDKIHYCELDTFILDTMDEWTLLAVTNETPQSAKERVFWHLIHQVSLHGAKELKENLFFKSEINTCLDFFNGIGSYPIDCIGWRPLP